MVVYVFVVTYLLFRVHMHVCTLCKYNECRRMTLSSKLINQETWPTN